MILEQIVHYIFKFLEWAVGQLPDWDPGHNAAIQDALDFCAGVNNWFPLTEIAECIGILLIFHGLLIVWRPILKFIRLA